MSDTRFTVGDFIEVSPKISDLEDTSKDFGVIRGTALDTRYKTGWAQFSVQVETGPTTSQVLNFNLNYVDVTVLFRADVARETGPQ